MLKRLCCMCYNVDMKYNVGKDIKIVSTILGLSLSQLAEELHVSRSTVTRIVNNATYPSDLFLENFYSFAYNNKIKPIRLNELKIRYANEKYDKILFHGARGVIEGRVDFQHSQRDIDVGTGFYLGESFEQASSYIFSHTKSSVYLFDTKMLSQLNIKEFDLSLEWMLMVCYYRGQIDEYKDSPLIKKIINEVEQNDVIIAPIADNNMYEIMNRFARGDITDLQATSALSASHLGKQHVLKTQRACYCISMVDRLYLCNEERQDIEKQRRQSAEMAKVESKRSIEELRRKGRYIEELLK